MSQFEVILEVHVNGTKSDVRTIVTAHNPQQARALAMNMSGIGGRIIFGPYPMPYPS